MNITAHTVDGQLRAASTDSPDRTALLFGRDRWSFAELNTVSRRVAAGIAGVGVQAGEHIAIYMGNRPEWLFAWLGAARIGRPVVAVNAAAKGDGLAHALGHADAVAVVVEDGLLGELMAVLPRLPQIRTVIVVDDDRHEPTGHLRWQDVVACPDEPPAARVQPQDPMMILYSSGTTGLPKGVVIAQSRCVQPSYLLRAAGITGDDIGFTALPFFHASGALVGFWGAFDLRIPLAVGRRFSASQHWEEMRRHGATYFNALGSIIPILMKQQPRRNDADNPCRLVISAGCPQNLWRAFEARFGVEIFEWYGTVEGGLTVAGRGTPVGSIGRPLPGTLARVVRPDGHQTDPYEVGELLFRPEEGTATIDYYRDQIAAEAKTRDDWLHTGDQVYRDDDGYLWYVGRGAHVIRRSGENIAPEEIETVLNAHPQVLESAAYAVASPVGEDDVAIAVVLRPGSAVTPRDLITYCEQRMARYQTPRYVRVLPELPKTATLKTQNLRLHAEGITEDTYDRLGHCRS